MGLKKSAGLIKRSDGNWHIDKQLNRRRICLNTGTSELKKAEEVLARVIEDERQARIFGVRPQRTFQQAADKYIQENQYLRSIKTNENRLKQVLPFIADIYIDQLHVGNLQLLIKAKHEEGIKTNTINHYLKIVRRILNLAASEWIDEFGLTWLSVAPKIKLLDVIDARKPHPMDWSEQEALIQELPQHLKVMAIFAANSGCRDSEICNLQWDWEVDIPQLKTSAFIIPEKFVKNGEERLVVLNYEAIKIIEGQRDKHKTHVFTYKNGPITRMTNSAWIKARERAGLPQVRIHDWKHTFGRRLRSAGVSFEDRQDLLGHRSGRITTHYSAAELTNLIDAANKVCDKGDGRPELVVLKRVSYGQ